MDIDITAPVCWRLDHDWFIQQLQDTENGQLKLIVPSLDGGSCYFYKELKLYLQWTVTVLDERVKSETDELRKSQWRFMSKRASRLLSLVKDCLKEGYRGVYYKERDWVFSWRLPLHVISHPDGNWVLST